MEDCKEVSMSIKGDLAEPEEPELNRTLKLFVCLLLRVQKSLVDDAPKIEEDEECTKF